jgi:hypothetical protein
MKLHVVHTNRDAAPTDAVRPLRIFKFCFMLLSQRSDAYGRFTDVIAACHDQRASLFDKRNILHDVDVYHPLHRKPLLALQVEWSLRRSIPQPRPRRASQPTRKCILAPPLGLTLILQTSESAKKHSPIHTPLHPQKAD